MITCEAKNKYEALEQFRLRTGFSLNGKYIKCRDIDKDDIHQFD
jgi:hypothetical protein